MFSTLLLSYLALHFLSSERQYFKTGRAANCPSHPSLLTVVCRSNDATQPIEGLTFCQWDNSGKRQFFGDAASLQEFVLQLSSTGLSLKSLWTIVCQVSTPIRLSLSKYFNMPDSGKVELTRDDKHLFMVNKYVEMRIWKKSALPIDGNLI